MGVALWVNDTFNSNSCPRTSWGHGTGRRRTNSNAIRIHVKRSPYGRSKTAVTERPKTLRSNLLIVRTFLSFHRICVSRGSSSSETKDWFCHDSSRSSRSVRTTYLMIVAGVFNTDLVYWGQKGRQTVDTIEPIAVIDSSKFVSRTKWFWRTPASAPKATYAYLVTSSLHRVRLRLVNLPSVTSTMRHSRIVNQTMD